MVTGTELWTPAATPETLWQHTAEKPVSSFIHAPEDKILEARAELASKGIYCEHTTAGNYAAYKEYCRVYGKTPDCLITMCGAGLRSDH